MYTKSSNVRINPEPNRKSNPKRLVGREDERAVDKNMEPKRAKSPVSTKPLGTNILPFQTSFTNSIVNKRPAKNIRLRPIENSVISHGSGKIDIGKTISEA